MKEHKNISTIQLYAIITTQKISRDIDLVSPKFAGMESAFITMDSDISMLGETIMNGEHTEPVTFNF